MTSSDEEAEERAYQELLGMVLEVLDEMKAHDVVQLHVASQTSLADDFVLCSGTSARHCRAIATELRQRLKDRGIQPLNPPESAVAAWTLLDYGRIIVHVLSREARANYRIEQLWNPGESAPEES